MLAALQACPTNGNSTTMTVSATTFETIIAQVGCMPLGLTLVGSHQLGGASARVGEDETAFSHRQAAYASTIVRTWSDPREREQDVQWVRESWLALWPFATSGMYVTFLDSEDGQALVRAAYGDAKYERLVALGAKPRMQIPAPPPMGAGKVGGGAEPALLGGGWSVQIVKEPNS
jgi:hypothetical protein